MKTNIWTFRYEPETLDEMIASDEKKKVLQKVIEELPNTLIAGLPGTGKGTFLNILKKTTGVDVLKINGSSETGVDMVRSKISEFSCAYSLNKKIVYINECDRLSPNAQNSLNQIIEDYQSITRYFFVCNNPDKITDPILSRCAYKINLNEPPIKQIYQFVGKILKEEKIKASKEAVISTVTKLYPDIRQIIGTLQSNVIDGKITNISYLLQTDTYERIFKDFVKQDIENVRKTLKSNYIDYPELYNHFYTELMDDGEGIKNPAEMIIKIGKFLYQDNFVAIKEINFMTFMLECMKEGVV